MNHYLYIYTICISTYLPLIQNSSLILLRKIFNRLPHIKLKLTLKFHFLYISKETYDVIMHHFAIACASKLACYFANHKADTNFSRGSTISGSRSSRPSEVAKAVYYDFALSGDSRFCGDTSVKCIDICHSRENRKKNFFSATHNTDKPQALRTNHQHHAFAVKAGQTDNISLHPVISRPSRRGRVRARERSAQEGTRRLCHRKKSYISLGYGETSR